MFSLLSEAVELDYDPCWVDGRIGNFNVSYWTLFRSLFMSINTESAEVDLNERVTIGDKRFIAVQGYGIEYPGLKKPEDYEMLCKYGWRVFSKTSDAYESKEAAKFGAELKEYAKQYNSLLLIKLKTKK